MTPGPLEESAKIASSFMDAMKSQPLALALVLCNLTLLGLFFYVASWAGDNRSQEFKSIMEMQREVQKLLYNCTPSKSGFRLDTLPALASPVRNGAPGFSEGSLDERTCGLP